MLLQQPPKDVAQQRLRQPRPILQQRLVVGVRQRRRRLAAAAAGSWGTPGGQHRAAERSPVLARAGWQAASSAREGMGARLPSSCSISFRVSCCSSSSILQML